MTNDLPDPIEEVTDDELEEVKKKPRVQICWYTGRSCSNHG